MTLSGVIITCTTTAGLLLLFVPFLSNTGISKHGLGMKYLGKKLREHFPFSGKFQHPTQHSSFPFPFPSSPSPAHPPSPLSLSFFFLCYSFKSHFLCCRPFNTVEVMIFLLVFSFLFFGVLGQGKEA